MRRIIVEHDSIFLIPFTIWLYFSIFGSSLMYTLIEPYYVLISLVCMGIIALRELFFLPDYTIYDYLTGVIALLFFVAFYGKDGNLMYASFLIFCARKIPFKSLAISSLISCSFSLITVIVSSQLGIITDYVTISINRTRHFLGFRYALFPSAIYFNVCSLYIYLRDKKINIFEIITLLLISILFYKYTDSRLSFAFTLLLLIIAVINKNIDFNKKMFIVFKFLLSLSFVFSFGVSIYFTMSYDVDDVKMVELDSKLSHRLKKGYESIERDGFALLPRNLDFSGNGLDLEGKPSTKEDNYVDSFYIQYAQKYGILFFASLIILWVCTSWYVSSKNQWLLLIIMSLFAAHGIIDDLIVPLHNNSFLLLLSSIIPNSTMIKQKE